VQIFYVVANTKEKSLWAERARVPGEEQFVLGEAVLRVTPTGSVYGRGVSAFQSVCSKGTVFNITLLCTLILLGDKRLAPRQLTTTGAGFSFRFKF
jgi:hypothetical protein